MSPPPKIVVPGLNRGAGIPPGYVLGRRRGSGNGPAELLDLLGLRQAGVATIVYTNQIIAAAVAALTALINGITTYTVTTTVDLVSGNLVSFGVSGLVLADATDTSKPAYGFVLAAFSASTTATVYKPGNVITGLSTLTPGGLCYLSTAGALTQVVPSSGASQIVGVAIDATRVLFLPGTSGLV